MVGYRDFVGWTRSAQSEMRGQAAFLVSSAYVEHDGPADEEAALYASVINFLDDPSVKVRAALAYGMLRSTRAPRVAILALVKDADVIARAVAQYSPLLIDADLFSLIDDANPEILSAIAARETLSDTLVVKLMASDDWHAVHKLLQRADIEVGESELAACAKQHGHHAQIRGELLKRKDLDASSRMILVQQAAKSMRAGRLVQGALRQDRAAKLFEQALDDSACVIGDEAVAQGDLNFITHMRDEVSLSARQLIHALLNGHALFFAHALSVLCDMPQSKCFSVLEKGGRPAIHALLSRSGMAPALQNLLGRLVEHAREADLGESIAARLFVVTTLIEDMISEHAGQIPQELVPVFAYLNTQNLKLAREASRGVLPGFMDLQADDRQFPMSKRAIEYAPIEQLALPAAS